MNKKFEGRKCRMNVTIMEELRDEAKRQNINCSEALEEILGDMIKGSASTKHVQALIEKDERKLMVVQSKKETKSLEIQQLDDEMKKINERMNVLEREKEKRQKKEKFDDCELAIYDTIKTNLPSGAEYIFNMLKKQGMIELASDMGIDVDIEYVKQAYKDLTSTW